ncbi:class I SAM-dependent methyltransferase [Candidatus Methylacidiphilum infernorum]|uniref:SAM-dependent methyltransferase n=1 Tax=Methylacidiphilum infernorum (isolate V4) TaxID=481448 RepID=B3DY24_METI4|nr:methyltransferase domain-containing protein [Candidatus Methylacidiphilum infernorum]ACD83976.1 SAM-dependent methyltransferase [Methylacidiphilum infernorum V4]
MKIPPFMKKAKAFFSRGVLCLCFSLFFRGHAATADSFSQSYRFKDPYLWSREFDSASRDKWQKPQAVLHALRLKPGEKIVDIGAGTGYFAVKFARAVGPEGEVLALDREPAMVDYLRKRAQKEGLNNLKVRHVPTNDPKLKKQSADLIFFCNSYHHIHNPGYLKKLANALKENGRICVIDIKEGSPRLFPSTAKFKKHLKLSAQSVVEDFTKAGFYLDKEFFFLPYQYFLEFKPGPIPSRQL